MKTFTYIGEDVDRNNLDLNLANTKVAINFLSTYTTSYNCPMFHLNHETSVCNNRCLLYFKFSNSTWPIELIEVDPSIIYGPRTRPSQIEIESSASFWIPENIDIDYASIKYTHLPRLAKAVEKEVQKYSLIISLATFMQNTKIFCVKPSLAFIRSAFPTWTIENLA